VAGFLADILAYFLTDTDTEAPMRRFSPPRAGVSRSTIRSTGASHRNPPSDNPLDFFHANASLSWNLGDGVDCPPFVSLLYKRSRYYVIMNLKQALVLALDPSRILLAQGLSPDPWQRAFLVACDKLVLLNCSRQSGKSTTTAALALHTALFAPGSLILLLSPTQRQSHELFRKVLAAYNAVGRPIPTVQDAQTMSKLELANGSRIIGLPGKEGTIRGYSKAALLILDEAARIPDELYRSVRPMLAVSGGRLIALSTPFGQRGWFWEEWERSGSFKKVRITWRDCPRITEEFIAQERASLGDQWVGQEFECQFGSLEGLVYPDFEQCLVAARPESITGKGVGGIDFGWRNPFAAVWGVLDRDDVLWIDEERYLRETPLHEHAAALKQRRGVSWVADPAGATEIAELRSAGLTVRRGDNDIRLGVAVVTARIRTGRLKVCSALCPNLCTEAKLYRYPNRSERLLVGEKPIDEHNHALGALRYLVSKLDARFIARLRHRAEHDGPLEEDVAAGEDRAERVGQAARRLWDDESLWERLS
jgi:hypothetical protein